MHDPGPHTSSQPFGVIRFALQFDSKCLNPECKHPYIGAGVRFNAKKKVAGNFLSAINIYEFTMKCPNCDQIFVIKTDPEKATYKYISGIKKMYSDYFESKK